MGDKTSIEWTEATWNPVRGCSRVSRGCENCYAEGVARRFAGVGQPYEGLVRIGKDGKAKAQWNGVVRVVSEHLADPLHWTRPRRVFVNSMSDLFHEALPFETIAAIFGVMAASPAHTFQVLTKRPERASEFFAWAKARARDESPSDVCLYEALMANPWEPRMVSLGLDHRDEEVEWPLPNVWLGVSVEDQATADERIPHLLACPAAVRWVSYEPALGQVDFSRFMWPVNSSWPSNFRSPEEARAAGASVTRHRQALVSAHAVFLDWIVVGGESGPGARPFDIVWARSVITQCREAGVACFVKQLGAHPVNGERSAIYDRHGLVAPGLAHEEAEEYAPRYDEGRIVRPAPVRIRDRKGGAMSEWPEDLRVREWPSRLAV
ncbi:MAG: phage Gp37/Gp68 family protein [Nannocystis sp.]|nr:phage Gp37/Gp68 family protein [Nannocystis sp.]